MLPAFLLFCTVLPSRVTPPVAPPRDLPVHVWLNFHILRRAGPARVFLRASDDGYVVVLRADAAGKVSVLFPLDPGDDNFVRGGQTIEVRSRGDLAAFFVDERGGAGTVLALWSADTLTFGEFAHGRRWDYRVLARNSVSDDPEAGLLAPGDCAEDGGDPRLRIRRSPLSGLVSGVSLCTRAVRLDSTCSIGTAAVRCRRTARGRTGLPAGLRRRALRHAALAVCGVPPEGRRRTSVLQNALGPRAPFRASNQSTSGLFRRFFSAFFSALLDE
ncbi:MAG: hypothetical protein DMD36_10920 [Gemmatimonadetes bacterium]|nr:MAG: hypothetical protein DMD36_10920 [Gemmatimonadota bacterium]